MPVVAITLMLILVCGTLIGANAVSNAPPPTSVTEPIEGSVNPEDYPMTEHGHRLMGPLNPEMNYTISNQPISGEAELTSYLDGLGLDQDVYVGFVWEGMEDGSYKGYIQFTDISYFTPYLETAKSFGCEFSLREVKYSLNDLAAAKEILKTSAREYKVKTVTVDAVDNSLWVETDNHSEENKLRLAKLCGVDNLELVNTEHYDKNGDRLLYYEEVGSTNW